MLICLKFALNNAFEAMDSPTKKKRTQKRSYEKCFEIFLIEMSNLRGLMHGSILPVTIPPPGNPGDKSSPSVPGVGNCLKLSCPGG